MKDFIKWLGNNEKVGKVIVWLLIIIIALIILNTTLMSLGLPHYQITEHSLYTVPINTVTDFLFSSIISILNFYSIILLIFKTTETKKIFKYSILYIILNCIVLEIFGYAALQIFILLYCILFSYFYSGKKLKYIGFALISIFINTIVQGVWYTIKVQLIDYDKINKITQSILSLDYFIIMGIIILVKEIYFKKRGESIGRTRMLAMGRTIQQRKDICKETSKKSIKSSKITNKEVVSTKK